jgi:hypothetical protein
MLAARQINNVATYGSAVRMGLITCSADNPAQSKRFIEAAKALGVDESGQTFKRALNKLIQKKPKGGSS